MPLAKTLIELQKEIGERYLLIDFDLFCRESESGVCNFVIDEPEKMEEVLDAVNKLRAADSDARFYVCTYSVDFESDTPYVYADTLQICTTLSKDAVSQTFESIENASPCDIVILSGAALEEEDVVLVLHADGSTESYTDFCAACEPKGVISVYWD